MLIDLTSVAERSDAGVEGRKVIACADSIRLLRDEFVTVEAGLGVVTGGCCFFFKASCDRKGRTSAREHHNIINPNAMTLDYALWIFLQLQQTFPIRG